MINDTFHDRMYRRFGLIIRPKLFESYPSRRDREAGITTNTTNVKFNCTRVLEHSWPLENQMLLARLKQYEPLFDHKASTTIVRGERKKL